MSDKQDENINPIEDKIEATKPKPKKTWYDGLLPKKNTAAKTETKETVLLEKDESVKTFTSENKVEEKSLDSDKKIDDKNDSVEVEKTGEVKTDTMKTFKKKTKLSIGKIISLLLIVASLTVLSVGAYYGYAILNTANKVVAQDEDAGCNGVFDLGCLGLSNPFNKDEQVKLKGQDEGRTNILVIGRDNAASLTDSIILISYYYKEQKMVTLNFPRDLYVSATFKADNNQPVRVVEKINALYPFAENGANRPNNGAIALSEFISSEFGIPIHYWVVENFRAVREIVNQFGGVTVNVDKAFTDCEYPKDDYSGYIRPCPSFAVGPQEMDGTKALIYARSRHAEGDPDDFNRSRRQSIVIQAIADKAKTLGIFNNINNINSYLSILGENVVTSISLKEMISFYNQTKDFDTKNGFLRVIWSTYDGKIWCPGPSAGRGYNIVYCGGGAILGSNSQSGSRKEAVNQVQNLLATAQSELLVTSQVAILGNQSNDTVKAKNAFTNSGFDALVFNNAYAGITAASKTSKEKTTIYIADETLRNMFIVLNPKPAITYTVEAVLPEGKVLPDNAKAAKIIVWIESVS